MVQVRSAENYPVKESCSYTYSNTVRINHIWQSSPKLDDGLHSINFIQQQVHLLVLARVNYYYLCHRVFNIMQPSYLPTVHDEVNPDFNVNISLCKLHYYIVALNCHLPYTALVSTNYRWAGHQGHTKVMNVITKQMIVCICPTIVSKAIKCNLCLVCFERDWQVCALAHVQ